MYVNIMNTSRGILLDLNSALFQASAEMTESTSETPTLSSSAPTETLTFSHVPQDPETPPTEGNALNPFYVGSCNWELESALKI